MEFSDEVVSRIRRNVFDAAQPAILDWKKFQWHTGRSGDCDSDQKKSSQALAVDVFGTLKMSNRRNEILNELCTQIGLTASQDWEIELEYQDPKNPLKERRLTQVDAVATSKNHVVFFECKFTETDGGSCRQILPIEKGARKGEIQCSGNYSLQRNPVNGKEAYCALSGKGILYWDIIPEVFDYGSTQEISPCPFRYSWYQWMRNLVNCYKIAQDRRCKPAFIVIYADGSSFSMARKIYTKEWRELKNHVRGDQIAFETMSYQNLISMARALDQDPDAPWSRLQEWVESKIAAATDLKKVQG